MQKIPEIKRAAWLFARLVREPAWVYAAFALAYFMLWIPE